MALENYGTIWVCLSCMGHHANGDCGDCYLSEAGMPDKHDEEPLSKIELPYNVSMGMAWEDHNDECLTFIINSLKATHPDIRWPEVPGDYECACDEIDFSHSQCEGCGSYLHGERYAMTLFKG